MFTRNLHVLMPEIYNEETSATVRCSYLTVSCCSPRNCLPAPLKPTVRYGLVSTSEFTTGTTAYKYIRYCNV